MIGGFREVVALGESAVEAFQQVYLFFSFRSFRDSDHSEILGQHDDDPDDLVAIGVAVHARDECAIDLQRIDRELLQAAERRISGTEIIHAQANAEALSSESTEVAFSGSPIAMVSVISNCKLFGSIPVCLRVSPMPLASGGKANSFEVMFTLMLSGGSEGN